MNLLAIETTGRKASVALINQKGDVYSISSPKELSHLQNLIPMISTLLKERGLAIEDLSCIAVSQGPGSFTGIRIGMATCKALAMALQIPVIGVPTLMSFAWNTPHYQGLICPVFDARQEQVYGGAYFWKDGVCLQAVPDGAYAIEDFFNLALNSLHKPSKKEIMIFGDGAHVYNERFKDWVNFNEGQKIVYAHEDVNNHKASSVARLALEKWNKGQLLTWDELEPVYIRKAEAQRRLEERLLNEKKSNKQKE
ncbi:MAG: tRNA (adenosine(37)-N6)-threonylcarbamoyltransferase complex dimerization subunit type 1 TsaB [Anaerovoracaceae bacterium]|jgi:tRNA threonylcarbamoyladenosine biosynthesis protein TsaB